MSDRFDLAIVGAGPAGMAAAIAARRERLSVVVFDQQPEPGGQIYRHVRTVTTRRAQDLFVLGAEYAEGFDLVERFLGCGADYRPLTEVWQIDGERRVRYTGPRGAAHVDAAQVLIATGALERPVPVPGWTLPGVLTCGAAQILLKTAALVPRGRIAIVGAGPLPLLVASQLIRAGVKPAIVIETVPLANYGRAAAKLLPAALAPGYLSKGLSLLGALRRAGVPLVRGASALRLTGGERVTGVVWRSGRAERSRPIDLVLLHQGVVPDPNLWRSVRVDTVWDGLQRCFRPRLDDWGRSSVEGVWIAGDGAGIGGAKAAECAGTLAALAIACDLGRIDAEHRDEQALAPRFALRAERKARPFLDALYRPGDDMVAPPDDEALVCRCEEVAAGEVRALAAQGIAGPNQLKAYSRCGMGPCQGRLCGLTVVELLAAAQRRSPDEIGYYRIRPPVRPLSVGELAADE